MGRIMMCGRFSLFHNAEEIRKRFKLKRLFNEWVKRHNIAPSQDILAVFDESGERVGQNVEWGLVPSWSAKGAKGIINARAETLTQKPTFRDSFQNKRCLIIADGFYEWKRIGNEKQPYRITLKDGGLFAFGGLYDERNGRRTAAIITTAPNAVMRPIHERMPLMLLGHDEGAWLDKGTKTQALEDIMRPYPSDSIVAVPIDRRINDPRNDGPDAIAPISQHQMTLLG
jgi:putative SOS response-associated peptidase YedK